MTDAIIGLYVTPERPTEGFEAMLPLAGLFKLREQFSGLMLPVREPECDCVEHCHTRMFRLPRAALRRESPLQLEENASERIFALIQVAQPIT